jgi:phage tail-like protein
MPKKEYGMVTETHTTTRNRRSFLRMVALGAGAAALAACGATAAKPSLTEEERAELEALGDEMAADLAAGKVKSLKGAFGDEKFSFQVEWNNQVLTFQEASGLDSETQVIEYRHSDSPVFSTIKMPGLKKYGTVTLKRGVANLNLQQFTALFSDEKMKRMPLIIKLLDETGQIIMTWTLQNAWFTKITRTDLNAFDEAEFVAIETMEVVHEGLTVS